MPHIVIHPFPPLLTQNSHFGSIFVAKRQFTAYFGNLLAPLGSHSGHFEPSKWVKMFSLNALGAVPTLFQHCSIKCGFLYGLNHENANFCPNLGLFGPLDGQMGNYLIVL